MATLQDLLSNPENQDQAALLQALLMEMAGNERPAVGSSVAEYLNRPVKEQTDTARQVTEQFRTGAQAAFNAAQAAKREIQIRALELAQPLIDQEKEKIFSRAEERYGEGWAQNEVWAEKVSDAVNKAEAQARAQALQAADAERAEAGLPTTTEIDQKLREEIRTNYNPTQSLYQLANDQGILDRQVNRQEADRQSRDRMVFMRLREAAGDPEKMRTFWNDVRKVPDPALRERTLQLVRQAGVSVPQGIPGIQGDGGGYAQLPDGTFRVDTTDGRVVTVGTEEEARALSAPPTIEQTAQQAQAVYDRLTGGIATLDQNISRLLPTAPTGQQQMQEQQTAASRLVQEVPAETTTTAPANNQSGGNVDYNELFGVGGGKQKKEPAPDDKPPVYTLPGALGAVNDFLDALSSGTEYVLTGKRPEQSALARTQDALGNFVGKQIYDQDQPAITLEDMEAYRKKRGMAPMTDEERSLFVERMQPTSVEEEADVDILNNITPPVRSRRSGHTFR